MKIILLLVSLGAFTTGFAQQTQTPDKKKLLGHWISIEDTSYNITFTDTTQREYYGNEIQNVNSYTLRGDTLITKDKHSGSVYTYSVMSLTNKKLTLLNLGRGNLLIFTKSAPVKATK